MKCLKSMIPILLILMLTTSMLAQKKEIGKIFTPAEAETLFGQVTAEKEIPVIELDQAMKFTINKVMFSIDNNQLYVLGDNRASIYPVNKILNPSKIVYSFSKSKVEEFLATNPGATSIKVQMRGMLLCLDNGVSVLEFSQGCPPYCFEE